MELLWHPRSMGKTSALRESMLQNPGMMLLVADNARKEYYSKVLGISADRIMLFSEVNLGSSTNVHAPIKDPDTGS